MEIYISICMHRGTSLRMHVLKNSTLEKVVVLISITSLKHMKLANLLFVKGSLVIGMAAPHGC